jgi:hypothetical protein
MLDRLRHLRFTFNDIADMQAVSPLIFEKGMGDFSVIRTFLWGGLRHEDPELQPYPAGEQKLGEIIEELLESEKTTIPDLASACTKAMNASTTIKSILKKKEQREKEQRATAAGGAPSKNLQETGSPQSSQLPTESAD